MAYDRNGKPVQFLPNWPNAHVPRTPAESTTTPSVHEESLDHVTLNELRQGELYILKIKLIVVALFQGWDDDMCCFSVLRMFFFHWLLKASTLSNLIQRFRYGFDGGVTLVRGKVESYINYNGSAKTYAKNKYLGICQIILMRILPSTMRVTRLFTCGQSSCVK